MGTVVSKEQCPQCHSKGRDRSKDNFIRYADGGGKCYSCEYIEYSKGGSTMAQAPAKVSNLVGEGYIESLPHRNITDDTCQKYNYQIREHSGTSYEIANYYDVDNRLVAQKIRNPDTKEFSWKGDASAVTFYGSNLVSPGGPMLVITEGEIDAMSVYQAFHSKYPALSIPNGAATAKKTFEKNVEFLNTFDKVVIFFDNDDPGQEAARAAADVLEPGKVYFASLSEYKDANDALKANKSSDIIQAVYNAREYRPDGILHIKDVALETSLKDVKIFDFPFDCMTQASYGLLGGEVCVMASGSGMGKSTVVRHMIKNNLDEGFTVGALMLEESPTKTKQDIASLVVEKPIHLALTAREVNRIRKASNKDPIDFGHTEEIDEELLKKADAYLNSKDLFVYDHWGSQEIDVLMKRLNYMAYACNCEIIYIDHLSIIVSGIEGSDERRTIDRLMAELKSFAQRTGVAVVAICHLKKSSGTPHEEGGQVSLSDFRGSGALYQYADKCFGFERDQQGEDDDANIMSIRLLKNRFAGRTGVVGAARFYPERYTLVECEVSEPKPFKDETNNGKEESKSPF